MSTAFKVCTGRETNWGRGVAAAAYQPPHSVQSRVALRMHRTDALASPGRRWHTSHALVCQQRALQQHTLARQLAGSCFILTRGWRPMWPERMIWGTTCSFSTCSHVETREERRAGLRSSVRAQRQGQGGAETDARRARVPTHSAGRAWKPECCSLAATHISQERLVGQQLVSRQLLQKQSMKVDVCGC